MNINNIATICFLLLPLIAGCTPSVRYTREQPVNPVDQSNVKKPPSPSRPPKTAAGAGGADSLRSSGWESSAGGGEEPRQSDWLASALSEADEGRPHQRSADVNEAADGSPQRLEQVIGSYIGVPYKYGGTTRNGFDCSGFTTTVYREVYGIELQRTSAAMWKAGAPVSLSSARPGDLVFFKKGGRFGRIYHVGIYVGGNRFAHASTTSGVTYNSLQETYYAGRFAGVRRMAGNV